MSLLFQIEGKRVFPNPETLLISPFKEIWDRDKSKDKVRAIEDLTYIEFFTSVKKSNPYRGYSEDIRKKKIMEDVIKTRNWEEDNLILMGIDKLKEFQNEASFTYSYYLSARAGAENLKNFFNGLNINSKNEKTGNPLYKPKDITSAILATNETLKNLDELDIKVQEELYESVKIRGQKEVSPFAKR